MFVDVESPAYRAVFGFGDGERFIGGVGEGYERAGVYECFLLGLVRLGDWWKSGLQARTCGRFRSLACCRFGLEKIFWFLEDL